MLCTTFFVADHAELAEGKLFVNGGWPQSWTLAQVPQSWPLTLVAVLEVLRSELDTVLPVTITMVNPAGEEQHVADLDVSEGPEDPPDGSPLRIIETVQVVVTFAELGTTTFRLLHDNLEIARATLAVRLLPTV
jgi:hypothetical protein